jgi:hypothetical protein
MLKYNLKYCRKCPHVRRQNAHSGLNRTCFTRYHCEIQPIRYHPLAVINVYTGKVGYKHPPPDNCPYLLEMKLEKSQ